MASTKRTIELLAKLEKLQRRRIWASASLPRDAWGYDTISAHRRYVEKHNSVRDINGKVQQRLELVLNAYRAGPFKRGAPVSLALAQAAVEEIPFDTAENE